MNVKMVLADDQCEQIAGIEQQLTSQFKAKNVSSTNIFDQIEVSASIDKNRLAAVQKFAENHEATLETPAVL